jgi:hypothetical protein
LIEDFNFNLSNPFQHNNPGQKKTPTGPGIARPAGVVFDFQKRLQPGV